MVEIILSYIVHTKPHPATYNYSNYPYYIHDIFKIVKCYIIDAGIRFGYTWYWYNHGYTINWYIVITLYDLILGNQEIYDGRVKGLSPCSKLQLAKKKIRCSCKKSYLIAFLKARRLVF